MATAQDDSTSGAAARPRQPQSNLRLRLVTGAVGIPIVLALVLIGGWGLLLLAIPLVVIGLLELYALGRARGLMGSAAIGIPSAMVVIIAVYLNLPVLTMLSLVICALAAWVEAVRRPLGSGAHNLLRVVVTVGGVVYLAFPAGFVLSIRALPDGLLWTLVLLAMTWGTDIVAFLGGRLWGRTPFFPHISPRKTVEGALAGVIGGMATALVLLALAGRLTAGLLPLVIAGPLVAILGDLLESSIKRAFEVKDSHLEGLDILPGHGGVLDRVDSLILVAVLIYFYLLAARHWLW